MRTGLAGMRDALAVLFWLWIVCLIFRMVVLERASAARKREQRELRRAAQKWGK